MFGRAFIQVVTNPELEFLLFQCVDWLLPTTQLPVAPTVTSSLSSDIHLWTIIDPEISRENPVEDKHRRLVRSYRSSPYDRELKPNAKIRDELGVSVHNNKLCF